MERADAEMCSSDQVVEHSRLGCGSSEGCRIAEVLSHIELYSFVRIMRHKGIIEMKLFINDINTVVMDFAKKGNLLDFLKLQREPICMLLRVCLTWMLAWQMRLKWAVQLSEAICFMHSNGVVHRDIKAANILVYICKC